MAARKVHKLNIAIDENYCLLGLASDEPDYKLCWMVNNELSMGFERMDDLELYHKKTERKQHFTMFQYEDEDTLLTYRIIKNRSEDGFFLEEFKNLDYVIHIQGEILTDDIDLFIHKVSGLQSVRMCVPVDLSRIKNRIRLELW